MIYKTLCYLVNISDFISYDILPYLLCYNDIASGYSMNISGIHLTQLPEMLFYQIYTGLVFFVFYTFT